MVALKRLKFSTFSTHWCWLALPEMDTITMQARTTGLIIDTVHLAHKQHRRLNPCQQYQEFPRSILKITVLA